MGDALKGLIFGVLIGGSIGFGFDFFTPAPPYYFGLEFTAAGAGVFGFLFALCGFLWGERFFDWLGDYWHHFLPFDWWI